MKESWENSENSAFTIGEDSLRRFHLEKNCRKNILYLKQILLNRWNVTKIKREKICPWIYPQTELEHSWNCLNHSSSKTISLITRFSSFFLYFVLAFVHVFVCALPDFVWVLRGEDDDDDGVDCLMSVLLIVRDRALYSTACTYVVCSRKEAVYARLEITC